MREAIVRWWDRLNRPARMYGDLPNRVHLRRGFRLKGHLPNVLRRREGSP
jgi:hypothetical protein